MTEIASGIIILLAVAVALLLARVAKKMVTQPEGTEFEITCPHCQREVMVELRLEPVEIKEEIKNVV